MVAKLVIPGISFLTSFLALKAVVLDKLIISGILSSMLLILALYISFLISFFTTSLSSFKSAGTSFNFSACTSDNLSTSNLSTSDFKLAISFSR